MHQAFDPGRDFDEGAELGQAYDPAADHLADGEAQFLLPGIAGHLLDGKRILGVTLLVLAQSHELDAHALANRKGLGRILDSGPAQLGNMHQALDAGEELDEGAKRHEPDDATVEHVADLDIRQEGLAVLEGFLLEQTAPADHDIAAAFLELGDHKTESLADKGLGVADRLRIHLTQGTEGPLAHDRNLEAALDLGLDLAIDRQAAIIGVLDLLLAAAAADRARELDALIANLDHVEIDLVAWGIAELAFSVEELGQLDDAIHAGAHVHEGALIADRKNLARNLLADLELAAALVGGHEFGHSVVVIFNHLCSPGFSVFATISSDYTAKPRPAQTGQGFQLNADGKAKGRGNSPSRGRRCA
ncbi:MAG: hypothetical protein BWY87_01345 [Deltaproteobacteria bacterium ADurb.Bin510]|nr:MAG: hypothetical protein BWY87_01345 [Deltaproteobacteria bacterium ADurb.Bin510]